MELGARAPRTGQRSTPPLMRRRSERHRRARAASPRTENRSTPPHPRYGRHRKARGASPEYRKPITPASSSEPGTGDIVKLGAPAPSTENRSLPLPARYAILRTARYGRYRHLQARSAIKLGRSPEYRKPITPASSSKPGTGDIVKLGAPRPTSLPPSFEPRRNVRHRRVSRRIRARTAMQPQKNRSRRCLNDATRNQRTATPWIILSGEFSAKYEMPNIKTHAVVRSPRELK